MFLGKHDRQLDDKGRLAIPAEYVRQLGDPDEGPRKLVFAPGKGGCICVFTRQDFDSRFDQLSGRFATEIDDEFFHKCHEREVDRAGRVLIDGSIRELAALPDPAETPVQVVVAGSGRYMQIWRKDRYDAAARPSSHFAEAVRP